MIPVPYYLTISAVLFTVGMAGVLVRRNALVIFMAIELMLNSVNINLAAFWRYGNVLHMAGQVFAVIVFAVAAAEQSPPGSAEWALNGCFLGVLFGVPVATLVAVCGGLCLSVSRRRA